MFLLAINALESIYYYYSEELNFLGIKCRPIELSCKCLTFASTQSDSRDLCRFMERDVTLYLFVGLSASILLPHVWSWFGWSFREMWIVSAKLMVR